MPENPQSEKEANKSGETGKVNLGGVHMGAHAGITRAVVEVRPRLISAIAHHKGVSQLLTALLLGAFILLLVAKHGEQ